MHANLDLNECNLSASLSEIATGLTNPNFLENQVAERILAIIDSSNPLLDDFEVRKSLSELKCRLQAIGEKAPNMQLSQLISKIDHLIFPFHALGTQATVLLDRVFSSILLEMAEQLSQYGIYFPWELIGGKPQIENSLLEMQQDSTQRLKNNDKHFYIPCIRSHHEIQQFLSDTFRVSKLFNEHIKKFSVNFMSCHLQYIIKCIPNFIELNANQIGGKASEREHQILCEQISIFLNSYLPTYKSEKLLYGLSALIEELKSTLAEMEKSSLQLSLFHIYQRLDLSFKVNSIHCSISSEGKLSKKHQAKIEAILNLCNPLLDWPQMREYLKRLGMTLRNIIDKGSAEENRLLRNIGQAVSPVWNMRNALNGHVFPIILECVFPYILKAETPPVQVGMLFELSNVCKVFQKASDARLVTLINHAHKLELEGIPHDKPWQLFKGYTFVADKAMIRNFYQRCGSMLKTVILDDVELPSKVSFKTKDIIQILFNAPNIEKLDLDLADLWENPENCEGLDRALTALSSLKHLNLKYSCRWEKTLKIQPFDDLEKQLKLIEQYIKLRQLFMQGMSHIPELETLRLDSHLQEGLGPLLVNIKVQEVIWKVHEHDLNRPLLAAPLNTLTIELDHSSDNSFFARYIANQLQLCPWLTTLHLRFKAYFSDLRLVSILEFYTALKHLKLTGVTLSDELASALKKAIPDFKITEN